MSGNDDGFLVLQVVFIGYLSGPGEKMHGAL